MTRHFIEFEQGDAAAPTRAEFSVDAERRTVTGLMVPWGQSARNHGKRWRFARGGIKWGHLNRVKLLRDHNNASAIGKAISIEDTDAGLVGTFKVASGSAGDEFLALAAEGIVDGLSIGVEWREGDYGPDPLDPGGYLVHQSALRECSATAMPAFEDSRLTSVRASDDQREDAGMPEKEKDGQGAPAESVTPEPQKTSEGSVTPAASGPATPSPEDVAARQQDGEGKFSVGDFERMLAAFSRAHGGEPVPAGIAAAIEPRPTVNPTAHATPAQQQAQVTEAAPYRFSYDNGRFLFSSETEHQLSGDIFSVVQSRGTDRAAEDRLNAFIKAQFDVDTTDAAGVIPKVQRPDLWVPQMDYATPLWDLINAGTTDGTPFEVPKFNTSSGLVSAATEGTEPAPGAFTVTTQTITPTQLWGKVEITRQLMRRGGRPEISGIIWDQMLREYYEDREAAIATFLNTLTAAADITITAGAGTNASDIISANDLEAAIAVLQFARGGNRFSGFAVHVDLYKTLARVQDTTGRKLYPQINPVNSNGRSASLFAYLDVAGTRAVPAYALGATGTAAANSWLFDPSRVLGWASPPERLEWNFGATVQTANIPQLAQVTMGIYGDIALANLDINAVRQVIYDPVA